MAESSAISSKGKGIGREGKRERGRATLLSSTEDTKKVATRCSSEPHCSHTFFVPVSEDLVTP